jgi:hypothetical protein
VDFSKSEPEVIAAVAKATRKAVVTRPITPLKPGQSIWLRIARGDENLGQVVDRCLAGTWRSVGLEYSMPDDKLYTVSPDASTNSIGCDFGEWTWQLNRHWEWSIAAAMYQETGDSKYASALATWMRNWLIQCPDPRRDINARQGPWRTIEIGIRLRDTWSDVLCACKDAEEIDDILWLAWLDSWSRQADFAWKYRKQNNWLLIELSGILHAGIELPFFKRSSKWREDATAEFIRQADVQVQNDGFQRELSTSYQRVCVSMYEKPIALMTVWKCRTNSTMWLPGCMCHGRSWHGRMDMPLHSRIPA